MHAAQTMRRVSVSVNLHTEFVTRSFLVFVRNWVRNTSNLRSNTMVSVFGLEWVVQSVYYIIASRSFHYCLSVRSKPPLLVERRMSQNYLNSIAPTFFENHSRTFLCTSIKCLTLLIAAFAVARPFFCTACTTHEFILVLRDSRKLSIVLANPSIVLMVLWIVFI